MAISVEHGSMASAPASGPHRYFDLNGLSELSGIGTARTLFERKPFKIRHEFAANSWFSRDRILELADALPESSVEYNLADIPVSQPVTTMPHSGLSLRETIKNIETCGSWVLLKSVEQHGDYAGLMNNCLEEIAGELGLRIDEMLAPRSFLFLTSSGGVTPFHFDPEHNFLLQIEGRKKIQIFEPFDRAIVSERQMRDFVAGAHRNLPFEESVAERGEWFDFSAGEGVYIPFLAPHWVKNTGSVSVSFSISFETAKTKRKLSSYRRDPADAPDPTDAPDTLFHEQGQA